MVRYPMPDTTSIPFPITRKRWVEILAEEKGHILGFQSIRGERYGGKVIAFNEDYVLVRSSGGLKVKIARDQTHAILLGGT